MNIKRIRLAAEISQQTLCKKYGIPLKTLQNWEANQDSPSSRECPSYVIRLLEQAVKHDFPASKNLLERDIDESHLTAIKQAKKKIKQSPLSKYTIDVFLYGSTARGQAKKTSDLDILLVLSENVKLHPKYNDWIIYLKGNISSDDFNTPETDLHIVFGENWTDNKDAFFENIKKEGFSIWN